MLNVNNKLYIRDEKNGITVYDKENNLYKFYEGLNIDMIEDLYNNLSDIKEFLNTNTNRINRNLEYSFPLRVNWLIDERCNLDCIYCFAHDKMQNKSSKKDIIKTANHILGLNVMNLGISGGEPTLNPYLPNVIELLKGKCSINIDTNGTNRALGDMAKLLKEADVLVRITIDSTNFEILNKLRPSKNKEEYLDIIYDNIKKLKSENVNLMVHTVVTKYNSDYLDEIAEKLISLGIRRWHLYGVNYCEKCKNIYKKIKISKSELLNIKEKLNKKYGEDLFITIYFNDGNYSANSVILIDSDGKFYLDSIFDGIKFIGNNPKAPTALEISKELDIKLHLLGYLWTGDEND